MRSIDHHTITPAVVDAMAGTRDERLKEVMTSLVAHLHDFAREVRLTEAEWLAAIRFLRAAGDITDDKRQEFILLSDALGLSTLVTALNDAWPPACTPSTVLGPFFVDGAPEYDHGGDIANGARGEPCYVSGQVRALGGAPIAGASIDVWQSDDEGYYDVQRADVAQPQARGRLLSGADGRYAFRTILAEAYPIPHDGPVGRLLAALGRHPWRPAHLHFMIDAPGYRKLITQVFRAGGRFLDSDAVFGVRPALIADWVRHGPGRAPHGTHSPLPFHTLQFDFVLAA